MVSTSSCGLDVFTRWSSASARGGGGARVQAPDGRQVPPSVNTERSIVGEGGLSRGYRQQVRSSMSVTSGHWHRPCWLGRADLADGEMVEEDDRTATYRSMEMGWELRVERRTATVESHRRPLGVRVFPSAGTGMLHSGNRFLLR